MRRLSSNLRWGLCPLVILATSLSCLAQQPTTTVVSPEEATSPEPVSLKGVVVAQKKYSFTVEAQGKRYQVKLGEDANIALLMNKPFFDWKKESVGVELKAKNSAAQTSEKLRRIQFKLPSKTLYVIAKFRSSEQLKAWQASKDKRLNYYLVTPDKLDLHEPTDDELYISGKITPDKKKPLVVLETEQNRYRVRLGFRTATMNGFSIADLQPQQTRVTLSGVIEKSTGNIVADSVAFEPVK